MANLKPCPFCGNTNLYIQMTRERGCDDQYQVICNYNWNGCGASTGYQDTPQEAVDAWNRRANYVGGDNWERYRCSECGEVYESLDDYKYCPNCGAKMEGENSA